MGILSSMAMVMLLSATPQGAGLPAAAMGILEPQPAAAQRVGLPLGIPPGPDDSVIARVAPEQCLLYVNWLGTAAPTRGARARSSRCSPSRKCSGS